MSSPEAASRWIAQGAQFFEIIEEMTLILHAAAKTVRDYRELLAQCMPWSGSKYNQMGNPGSTTSDTTWRTDACFDRWPFAC